MLSTTTFTAVCGLILITAACVVTIILIPIVVPFSTLVAKTSPDCDHYIRNKCIANCGCSWCDTMEICVVDIGICAGLNITSAGQCSPDYTGLYITISVVTPAIIIGLICLITSCVMALINQRYISIFYQN